MPVAKLRPSAVVLPPGSSITRDLPASRPAGLVDDDLAAYDRHTVFFDVFFAARSHLLLAIGPPLLNLERTPLCLAVRDGRGTKPLRRLFVRRQPSHWTHVYGLRSRDPVEVSVRLGDLVDTTVVAADESRLVPDRSARGPVTLVTMQKDNPPAWVRQWISYHHVLGIDDFVVYDNGSADRVGLDAELELLPPEVNVLVVDWSFPYGPVKWKAASYARRGSIEHWERALGGNRWYLGTDVDEYVVLGPGVDDVHALVRRLPTLAGMVVLDHYGVPVVEPTTPPGVLPMASDFTYRDRLPSTGAPKFLARPHLCRGLGVHRARARPFRILRASPDDVYFLHYGGLNTDWKGEGRARVRTREDEDVVVDDRVAAVFERHDIPRAVATDDPRRS